ncbi:MAG TPA: hypothetical protein VFU47_06315, partial [Armatimonadota bacterium]|nr:hypothetical protein [Armatimonadota bacterium]
VHFYPDDPAGTRRTLWKLLEPFHIRAGVAGDLPLPGIAPTPSVEDLPRPSSGPPSADPATG